MIDLYAEGLGIPVARKHHVWYLEEASRRFPEEAMETKRSIVRMSEPAAVLEALAAFYRRAAEAEPDQNRKREAA